MSKRRTRTAAGHAGLLEALSGYSGPLARGLLLLHLVLCPLIFCQATVEVFEYNKTALLMVVALLLAGLLLPWLPAVDELRQGMQRCWRDPLLLGLLLFLLSALLSTIFSISPRTSWRGAPDSHAGLKTLLAYGVLFLVTRGCISTGKGARWLLTGSVVAGAGVSTYALIQAAGLDPLTWEQVSLFKDYWRPVSTLGHPTFLGAFLAMILPIQLLFAWEAWRGKHWGALSVLLLLTATLLAAVVLTLSRGTWVAVLAAGAVLLVGWRTRGSSIRIGRVVLALLLTAGLGLAALLIVAWATPESPLLQRLGAFTQHDSRRAIWDVAVAIFRDHPWLGCGPDTLQLIYGHYRTHVQWNAEWGMTPVRAHNELLHILATQGLLGLLAAGVFFFGLGRCCWRLWRQGEDRLLSAALMASLAACFVHLMVNFTVAACGTLCVTLCALLSRFAANAQEDSHAVAPSESPARRSWPLFLGVGLAGLNFATHLPALSAENVFRIAITLSLLTVATGLALWAMSRLSQADGCRATAATVADSGRWYAPSAPAARWGWSLTGGALLLLVLVQQVLVPYQANRSCREGDILSLSGGPQAIASYEKAVRADPADDLVWTKLGTGLRSLAASPDLSKEARWQLLGRAGAAMRRALALVGSNPYHRARLAQVLADQSVLGQPTLAEVLSEYDGALAGDPDNAHFLVCAAQAALNHGALTLAAPYVQRGLSLYPHYPLFHALQGHLDYRSQRYAEAIRFFQAGSAWHRDWPTYEDMYWHSQVGLAKAHLQLNQPTAAIPIAKSVLARKPHWPGAQPTLTKALEMGRAPGAAGP
jgi:O-antigen ligase/tetratricopeptide (TPR) repeat protein